MELEGIHHVTAITGDAQRNVDFYAGVLGLRLVKKTVNQDNPTVYHLFYADEKGDAGLRHHLLRVSGGRPRPRRRRDGPPHPLARRLGGRARLLERAPRRARRRDERRSTAAGLRFSDPEGLEHELLVPDSDDEPLTAEHPGDPRRASRSRASTASAPTRPSRTRAGRCSRRRWASSRRGRGALWELRGEIRGSHLRLRRAARRRSGVQGAGTRAPRGLGVAGGGARGLARPGDGGRDEADPGDRPLLLPLRLLPRAERRPVRDRDPRGPRLRDRRADRAPRREALPAAVHRAPARGDRAEPAPDRQPAPGARPRRRLHRPQASGDFALRKRHMCHPTRREPA